MWDLGCILATALFFIAAAAYLSGCERLGPKDVHQ
jgi:hypothetical protein